MNKIIYIIVAISLLVGIVFVSGAQNVDNGPFKKVQPVVKLKTLNAKISNNTDGLIEIVVNNPSQNALNIDVEAIGNVYFFGKIFPIDGVNSVAGGNFIVPPGQQRTEDLMIRSGIVGSYPVKINIEYYTEANEDVLPQKISFAQTFKVTEKSHNIPEDRFLGKQKKS